MGSVQLHYVTCALIETLLEWAFDTLSILMTYGRTKCAFRTITVKYANVTLNSLKQILRPGTLT
ncbi:hypothetical protein Ocin01_07146 [Orchesella cincta]|uniref:Uncharacterized protein n=1 Tax=Orchesella cincta TaxID=48709 RepID=A0A1D2N2L2_ORCCI|nr:hypothetical protein Ocin01_07146 [Orchesella cincta]